MPNPFTWPPENVERLKVLWSAGHTATVIAERLPGNYTRNSVLGKVHRLNLETRDPAECRTQESRHKKPKIGPIKTHNAREGVVAKDLAPIPQEPAPIGPLGDFPAKDTCRYPHGVGETFQCCGHPGFPYCEFHHKICRVPPNTNRLRGAR